MPPPSSDRDTTQPAGHERLVVWPNAPAIQRSEQSSATFVEFPLDLAAQIVHRLSTPDAIVVDPDCGAAIPLIAAAASGRRAVGVAPDLRSARIAASNLEAGLGPTQRLLVEIRISPTGALEDALADLAGTVDLIVANLANRRIADYGTASRQPRADDLTAAGLLLRPGGLLAVVTGAQWPGEPPPDPGDRVGQRLSAAGLIFRRRVLAQSIGRIPHPARARNESALRGLEVAIVHHSLLVFTRRGGPRG